MSKRDRTEMIQLIGNLLAKAESQAGTPEGDLFEERAFQLLAKHGIDHSQIRSGCTTADSVVREDYPVNGDYVNQQIMLLARIASALHCAAAYWLHSQFSATVVIYGVPQHLERIHLLYAPLRSRMLSQATDAPGSAFSARQLLDRRIGWMQGFTLGIRARLQAAETAAAAEADRQTGSDLQTRTLAADAKRAANAKKLALPDIQRGTYNPKLDRDSIVQGYRVGNETEIGPTIGG